SSSLLVGAGGCAGRRGRARRVRRYQAEPRWRRGVVPWRRLQVFQGGQDARQRPLKVDGLGLAAQVAGDARQALAVVAAGPAQQLCRALGGASQQLGLEIQGDIGDEQSFQALGERAEECDHKPPFAETNGAKVSISGRLPGNGWEMAVPPRSGVLTR